MPRHATITWITEEPEFVALRSAWNDLASTARAHQAFLRHEWFDAAWQWRKVEGCALRIVVVARDREVLGICPLVLRRVKRLGWPVAQLEFLSVPDTQFCDVVTAQENGSVVCSALSAALGERARDWDMLDLRHLPENASASALPLESGVGGGPRFERSSWDTNAFIDLDESWDDFYGRRGRSLKKANNLAANRLTRAGKLEIQWLRGTREARGHVEALLEEFVAVSKKSWKVETALTLDNPGPGAFIRRLTHHASEQDWLSMWGLRLDGRLVALEYQLISGGEVFALRADFDQSLESISPGSYLSWQLLQQLFRSGLKRYWLGPGVNPYKARWTDRGEPLFRITGFSPSAKGRMLRLNEQLLRRAKIIRAAVRSLGSREGATHGAEK